MLSQLIIGLLFRSWHLAFVQMEMLGAGVMIGSAFAVVRHVITDVLRQLQLQASDICPM